MTYDFLQHYWCFIVALLGALLVFLLFVQGANSVARSLGYTEEGRRLVYNSTGRKWEFTFTTLVTFGGAFFASYPLFYSTSFGGAYWLWMIILFTFVLQAVSYEFQNKIGNILGPKTFQFFLTLNGIVGPLLLGGAVATFFEGSNFIIGVELHHRERQPGGPECHHPHHLPLGQRLPWPRCLTESLGSHLRLCRCLPRPCSRHSLCHQQCQRRGHTLTRLCTSRWCCHSLCSPFRGLSCPPASEGRLCLQ